MRYKIECEKNIEYLGPQRSEKLDLYYPSQAADGVKYPGIVVIHGGGWFTQSKDLIRETTIASSLAAEGYVCACIDYKLIDIDSLVSPQDAWPTNLQDCRRAVSFLRDNADKYHIDGSRIGAIGGSAGAHLAALLACADNAFGPPPPESQTDHRIGCAVILYGIGDIHHWLDNSDCNVLAMTALELMLGGTRAEKPDAYRAASPLEYASSASPPLLLMHGAEDSIISCKESEFFAKGLADIGAPHELIIVEGAGHSFYKELFETPLHERLSGFLARNLESG
ncbi:MAG: alpha/beta hydrolase [Spirochaetales bacterium]|jgi:acetyl esterase/lipase|nr:alpha/beta hydrolase [Spirochaetales bacterium]